MFGELSEEKICVVKLEQIIISSLYKADQSHSNKLKKSSKILSIDNYGFLFVKRTLIVVILNFIRFEDFEAKWSNTWFFFIRPYHGISGSFYV